MFGYGVLIHDQWGWEFDQYLFPYSHRISDGKICENNSNVNWAHAIQSVRRGYLSELKFAEERPYDQHDFCSHFDQSYKSLQNAADIIASEANIENTVLRNNKDVLRHFTVSTLLLCGENVQSKEWNESRHIEIR